jgi:hypothetical protein
MTSTVVVSATTLSVNCGGNTGLTSIGAALKALQSVEDRGPNVINVTGICHENIRIQGFDRLTLKGVNGAQIIDASRQTTDTVIITQSQNILVQGFTVTGGFDAFDVYDNATARLVNITSQGALYDGVGVYKGANVTLVDVTLQNNGLAGLLVWGGDAAAAGITAQSNYDGIIVNNGSRAHVGISDPYYDGSARSLPANIANNQDNGVIVQRGEFRCSSCSITGNSRGGLFAEFGASVTLNSYFSASVPHAPATTIDGNNGYGVVVGALTDVTFSGGTTVSSNGGLYQIACNTPTSVTRNASTAAGGAAKTNCSNY